MSNQQWTWAQVAAMTLDEVLPLLNYWQKHPPLRDLVAAFIGFKPAPDQPSEPPRSPTIAEIKTLYPDGIIRG